NCKAYDPAFAGELAVIIDHGMRAMLEAQRDEFYYITVMNENYAQPDLPQDKHEDVVRGAYHYARYEAVNGDRSSAPCATLLGSGAILTEALRAARTLADEGITVDVYSITSWSELAREGQAV